MLFKSKEIVKNDTWIDEGRKVTTEKFRFSIQFKFKNYRLSKDESDFLKKIIDDVTEGEKFEIDDIE